MNGPLAQIVALTCASSAFLRGLQQPVLFPGNSTCQFCDSITFVEFQKSPSGETKEVVAAISPDDWLLSLPSRRALKSRLSRQAGANPSISDRMSAGFVGGGGTWWLELMLKDGKSEFWAARWQVWNKDAPNRKIWRVTYGMVGIMETAPRIHRDLKVVKTDFEKTLQEIRAFSEQQNCGSFTQCFDRALEALQDANADVGYHKDLFQPGMLPEDAVSMLKAAMSAWVFGGMGSWNDMWFEGDTGREYDRVSGNLFRLVNEAIEVAGSSGSESPSIQ